MHAHKKTALKNLYKSDFQACFERYLINTKHVDVNHQSLLNVVAIRCH